MRVTIELTYPQGEMYAMLKNGVPFPLFVGGYGCGKSEILVTNAIRDVMEFRGCKVACYAPTHDLLDLNLVPRIETRLDELGIKHQMNKSKHILHIQGNRQVIFRSMDNPKRIVAYEVYRSHVDEVDLMHTVKKGEEAWNRIIARNRQNRVKENKPVKKNGRPNLHKNHFNMVSGYSTPEGFKFTYKRWKKDPGEGYKYVTAPTSSNWNLDEAYIKNILDTYTPEQCKAYMLGKWTNIFTGSVYSYFDKDRHHVDRIIIPREELFIGCDFNYGGSCGSVYVPKIKKTERKGLSPIIERIGLDLVEEFVTHDTEDMIKVINDNYPGHPIYMFPDATGTKHGTNASISDIAMLRQAGFEIKANSTNPRIVDRINAVQRMLYNDLFGINTDKCPKTVEAMTEHAYSELTGLPEKIPGPGTIDDRNDSMGYCPAYLYPIRKNTTNFMEM